MIRLSAFFGLLISLQAISQIAANNFLTGRTNGKLPYLEYGLGSDRLGGAKMTFLDTGVVVKVIDSTVVNYRVQLSENHFAYLPKANFKRDSAVSIKPYYLTGSWLVNGDDKYDYVILPLKKTPIPEYATHQSFQTGG